ncbi:hypothetical protein [Haloferula sp. BvORR071]|uniref:hypothetical protein n=1 Tax=Haloferula sp. BvORR071 TaxID=1396141 RepID=UPI00054E807E|nr:hypothetical protein [Haloferula sp. BvORR071]
MKSLVRLVVESRLTLDLAEEPMIEGDCVIKHDEETVCLLREADEQTVDLIMEVIEEMTEESREGMDPMREPILEDLPVCWGLAFSEDDLESYDPEDPRDNPALRPKLENRLDLFVRVLVELVLFYWQFRVDPEFSRQQFVRIGHQLKQESPETIEAFLASIRSQAEEVTGVEYREYKEALLVIPCNLGLVPDPR